jgi:hypothetical protein
MKTHKVWQTFRALGAPIGFLLAFSIVGSAWAQDQHTSTDTDWWMVSAVLLVGLLQLGVFGYQARQLRKTVEATQKYAQTAREEMISAHPPKFIVRRIVLNPYIGDASFQLGNELNGSFNVINNGRSKGTITQNHSMIFITDKALPMKPPYEVVPHQPLFSTPLETGYAATLNIRKGITINTEIMDAMTLASNWKLYVMGWIDYLDTIDRPVSRLHFCRVWNPRKCRFMAVDNPDYESEERA